MICLLLSTLPNELHLMIHTYLTPSELHTLSLTCHSLHHLIGPIKLTKQETLPISLRLEESSPRINDTQYLYLCHQCLRLAPYYHFGYLSAVRLSGVLICLRCECKMQPIATAMYPTKWWFGMFVKKCARCGELIRAERVPGRVVGMWGA